MTSNVNEYIADILEDNQRTLDEVQCPPQDTNIPIMDLSLY